MSTTNNGPQQPAPQPNQSPSDTDQPDQHDSVRQPEQADQPDQADQPEQHSAGDDTEPRLDIHRLVADLARRMSAGIDTRRYLAEDPDLDHALRQARQEALDVAAAECRALAANDPDHAQPTGRPRDLAGSILVSRNRTSTPRAGGTPTRSWGPSKADAAAMAAAEHLAHDLLGSGFPDALAAQRDAIAHFASPIYAAYEVRKLERKGVHVAEAAARHYLNHCRPIRLKFMRSSHLWRWYVETRDDAIDWTAPQGDPETDPESPTAGDDERAELRAEASHAARTRILRRPRLVWVDPEGPQHGILLDRFHHTHERGVLENDQTNLRKVTEDLASIDALLRTGTIANAEGHLDDQQETRIRAANLGVRVIAHRVPNLAVHFLPAYLTPGAAPVIGKFHRVGDCADCATTPTPPNGPTRTSPARSGPHVTIPAPIRVTECGTGGTAGSFGTAQDGIAQALTQDSSRVSDIDGGQPS